MKRNVYKWEYEKTQQKWAFSRTHPVEEANITLDQVAQGHEAAHRQYAQHYGREGRLYVAQFAAQGPEPEGHGANAHEVTDQTHSNAQVDVAAEHEGGYVRYGSTWTAAKDEQRQPEDVIVREEENAEAIGHLNKREMEIVRSPKFSSEVIGTYQRREDELTSQGDEQGDGRFQCFQNGTQLDVPAQMGEGQSEDDEDQYVHAQTHAIHFSNDLEHDRRSTELLPIASVL